MPRVVGVGRRVSPHEDFYHFILGLTWVQFFALVSLGFVVINCAFASAYALSPRCISNTDGFVDLFFFSVQTLGTIGYGGMTPQTRYGHLIVSGEALFGILTSAIITGLTFARFARPTARVLFSDKAVIGLRNGDLFLMFRLANWRHNQLVEANLHAIVLVSETTAEGENHRRPIPLKLERPTNPMFALTWTAMHRIDEHSPFYGEEAVQRLREKRAEIFLTVNGIDETIMQTVTARYRYQLDDIVMNARFSDIMSVLEDGTRVIDYTKFHDVISAPASA